MTPNNNINHDPIQERPYMHMADTIGWWPEADRRGEDFYKKEVASFKKRHKDTLAKYPLAMYIKPPKGGHFSNEDHFCPFRVEYRGFLYEENQGSQLVIAVSSEGYRTVIGPECGYYETMEHAFKYIDSLVAAYEATIIDTSLDEWVDAVNAGV